MRNYSMKRIIYSSFVCLFLFSNMHSMTTQTKWVIQEGSRPVKTIFYQGMLASQVQAVKYMGPDGFIATTGEHVACDKAIDIIADVWVKPEIDEICPLAYGNNNFSIFTAPIDTICGFLVRKEAKGYGITLSSNPDAMPTHTFNGHRVYFGKISLGQKLDLDNHQRRYNACTQGHPDADYILFGVSKGAASTFCAHAEHQYKNVKLAVLEGCFDSLSHIVEERLSWLSHRMQHCVYHTGSKFTSHNPNGIAPVDMVHQFPKETPVAFITSKADTLVPVVCTKNIAQKLVDAGHPRVYLLELERSSHPRYMMDDEEDKNNYQNFVHALYKKYELPYIAEYAHAGAELLEKCLLSPGV